MADTIPIFYAFGPRLIEDLAKQSIIVKEKNIYCEMIKASLRGPLQPQYYVHKQSTLRKHL